MKVAVRGEFDTNSYNKVWLSKLVIFEQKLLDFFADQSSQEIVEVLFVLRILENDDFYLNPLLKYAKSKKIFVFSTELRKYQVDEHTDEQIVHDLLVSFRNGLVMAFGQKKIVSGQLVNDLDSFIQTVQ